MNSAIRARREAEDGFTLIELLVVVIIIGILAAIAIPAFLNQRERAWQSELTSEVRNYALEVEAEATSNGGAYPAAAGAPTAGGSTLATGVALPSAEGVVTFLYTQTGGGTGFTLCGEHDSIDDDNDGTNAEDHRVQYSSAAGGIQGFESVDCL